MPVACNAPFFLISTVTHPYSHLTAFQIVKQVRKDRSERIFHHWLKICLTSSREWSSNSHIFITALPVRLAAYGWKKAAEKRQSPSPFLIENCTSFVDRSASPQQPFWAGKKWLACAAQFGPSIEEGATSWRHIWAAQGPSYQGGDPRWIIFGTRRGKPYLSERGTKDSELSL